jgi:hypothetical protein
METNTVARLFSLNVQLRNARRAYTQMLTASKAGVENDEQRLAARSALRALYHERDVVLGLREEETAPRVEGHMVDLLDHEVLATLHHLVLGANAVAA